MRTKVFGVGLNKTGTTTLGVCLRRLGYRHLSYDYDLVKAWEAGDFDKVFAKIDQYESFEDWPYPVIFRQLAERYPDAKFILTIRKSPKTWLASLAKHSLRTRPIRNARKAMYGKRYPDNDPDLFLRYYEKHNASVIEELGDRVRVICWENGDGWHDIAEFLGVDVPDEPLPHANPAIEGSKSRLLGNRVMRKLESVGII